MYDAAEIMTTPVVNVSPDDTLEKAVKLLMEHQISGLPVVDSGNKVIGIITEKDIVKYSDSLKVISFIDSAGWVSPYTDVDISATFKKGFELLSTTNVKDAMSKKAVTVKEDASGEEIAKIFKKKHINRVPVVNEKNELVGIISRANLIAYLAER